MTRKRSPAWDGLPVQLVLADAVLCSFWFNRRQAWQAGDHDESWCNLCDGKGGYSDYGLSWHDRSCPVRLASVVLARKDPLGYSVMAAGHRLRWLRRLAAA